MGKSFRGKFKKDWRNGGVSGRKAYDFGKFATKTHETKKNKKKQPPRWEDEE